MHWCLSCPQRKVQSLAQRTRCSQLGPRLLLQCHPEPSPAPDTAATHTAHRSSGHLLIPTPGFLLLKPDHSSGLSPNILCEGLLGASTTALCIYLPPLWAFSGRTEIAWPTSCAALGPQRQEPGLPHSCSSSTTYSAQN